MGYARETNSHLRAGINLPMFYLLCPVSKFLSPMEFQPAIMRHLVVLKVYLTSLMHFQFLYSIFNRSRFADSLGFNWVIAVEQYQIALIQKYDILSPLHNKEHSRVHQISLFREACREPTRGIYSLGNAYIHIFATDIPYTILIYSQFLTH